MELMIITYSIALFFVLYFLVLPYKLVLLIKETPENIIKLLIK